MLRHLRHECRSFCRSFAGVQYELRRVSPIPLSVLRAPSDRNRKRRQEYAATRPACPGFAGPQGRRAITERADQTTALTSGGQAFHMLARCVPPAQGRPANDRVRSPPGRGDFIASDDGLRRVVCIPSYIRGMSPAMRACTHTVHPVHGASTKAGCNVQ